MVASALSIDTSQVNAFARALGSGAVKIVNDELTTAMTEGLQDTQAAVTRRVKARSGRYGQSFHRQVSVSGTAIVGTLSNDATSDTGFGYSVTLEDGRGAVVVKSARALRFTVGGQTLFRHSVGPARAQHPMEYGLQDATPQIEARFAAAGDRIAVRIEALR